MVKNHLKRLNAPKTWAIDRKENKFITRPSSTGTDLSLCLPLSTVLIDLLKVGKTTREIKHILNNNDILISGKRRKDPRFPLGFLDIIEIKTLDESYRLVLSNKGKLEIMKIDDKDKKLLLKVKVKRIIKKGMLQLTFVNGFTLTTDRKDINVNDTVVFDCGSNSIKDVLKLVKGNTAYLISGKYIGEIVKIEDIKDKALVFKNANNDVLQTSLKYAYIVGTDKPLISLKSESQA